MARTADGLHRARQMALDLAAFVRARKLPDWECHARTAEALARMFETEAAVESTSPNEYVVCPQCLAVRPIE